MSQILDIETIVEDYAWNIFTKTSSKKLQCNDAKLEVDWSGVKFHSSKTKYQDERMENLPEAEAVFKSTFRNDTNIDQVNTVQTERSTSCVSKTTVTKGFKTGFNLGIKLAVPGKVVEATGGFGREITMQNADEDTQEKKLTWTVNSTNNIPKKSSSTIQMTIKEKSYSATFTIEVQIKGKLLVKILSLRDNFNLVQVVEADFVEVMKHHTEKRKDDAHRHAYKIEGRSVIWEIQGKCGFRFGVEQDVKIS